MPVHVHTTIPLAAIIISTWSVWTRRLTWTSRWEWPQTLTVAASAAATALVTPICEDVLGSSLRNHTGVHNLHLLAAHLLSVVALASAAFGFLMRLAHPDELRRQATMLIWRPAGFAAAAMITAFILFNCGGHPATDLERWQVASYFAAAAPVCLWLEGLIITQLIHLRQFPRHRPFADLYLLAALAAFTATGCELLKALPAPFMPNDVVVTVASCAWVGVFALTAGWSWRRKISGFSALRSAVK